MPQSSSIVGTRHPDRPPSLRFRQYSLAWFQVASLPLSFLAQVNPVAGSTQNGSMSESAIFTAFCVQESAVTVPRHFACPSSEVACITCSPTIVLTTLASSALSLLCSTPSNVQLQSMSQVTTSEAAVCPQVREQIATTPNSKSKPTRSRRARFMPFPSIATLLNTQPEPTHNVSGKGTTNLSRSSRPYGSFGHLIGQSMSSASLMLPHTATPYNRHGIP